MGYLFGFGGRFSRLDWWLAQGVVVAIYALGFVYLGVSLSDLSLKQHAIEALFARHGWELGALVFCCAWIAVAAAAKRYHDRDKSGWWCLIVLIPYIGGLWQFVECGFLPGDRGRNSYGEAGLAKSAAPRETEDESVALARMRFVRTAELGPSVAPTPRADGFGASRPAGFGRRGR